MKLIKYLILIILCTSSIVKAQQSCRTPNNEPGTCTLVNDCKPIVNLILQSVKEPSASITEFLLKSFCGLRDGEHFVCCSSKHTTIIPSNNMPRSKTEDLLSDAPKFGKIEDVSNHRNLNLLPEKCGIIVDNKLSNGQNANIDEYAFMALLQYETPQGLGFKCGGTIINERYILTAAHCVKSFQYKLVSVRVGEHTISTKKDCFNSFVGKYCNPPVEDIEVEETSSYPHYNRPPFGNDIALIRLRKDINLNNSNMKAICLPINNETQYKHLDNLLTSGWGYTEANMTSDILLKATLRVEDQDICQKKYGSKMLLESHICAGANNRTDTCSGDSGGPVFFHGVVHNNVRNVQYGIIAAGPKACGGDHNIPGIYTNISYYMKWILDQLRK